MDSEVSKSINSIIIFLFLVYVIIAYVANEISFRSLNTRFMRNRLETCKHIDNKITGCDYKPFIAFIGVFTGWMLVFCTIFFGIIYLTVGGNGERVSPLDLFIYPEISYMLLNTANLITIYFLTIVIVLCSVIPLTKALNNHRFYINDNTRRNSLNVLRNYNFVYNILISAVVLIFITSLLNTAYYDILFGFLLRLKKTNKDRFVKIIDRNLTYLHKVITKYNDKF